MLLLRRDVGFEARAGLRDGLFQRREFLLEGDGSLRRGVEGAAPLACLLQQREPLFDVVGAAYGGAPLSDAPFDLRRLRLRLRLA